MHLKPSSLFLLSISLLQNTAFAAAVPGEGGTATVTRAQLTQAMVQAVFSIESIESCLPSLSKTRYRLLFTDVTIEDSYAPALCMAMKAGMVKGYKDGSFRPNKTVNFAEAAKIITRAMAMKPGAGLPEGSPWYMNYVKALEARGAIPLSVTSFDQPMTKGNLDDIMNRLRTGVTTNPSRTYDEIRKRMESKRR